MTITILPWRHDSELAFARDCFYPHYAAVVSSDNAVEEYQLYDPNVSTFSTRQEDEQHMAQNGESTKLSGYAAGLHRAAIWSSHSPNRIPTAIRATVRLIEAKLHDKKQRQYNHRHSAFPKSVDLVPYLSETARGRNQDCFKKPPGRDTITISISALQSIYAMAIIKFVNGFVDRDVVKAYHNKSMGLTKISSATVANTMETTTSEIIETGASVTANIIGSGGGGGDSSMYAHAITIGLPSHFVDIRHRCVHGEHLPNLDVLRETAEQALEWLWVRWWKANSTGDSGRFNWEQEENDRARREAMAKRSDSEGVASGEAESDGADEDEDMST